MSIVTIQRFGLTLFLVFIAMSTLVEGQYGNCRDVIGRAVTLNADRCGCTAKPVCTTCYEFALGTTCTNQCLYYTGTPDKTTSVGYFSTTYAENGLTGIWGYKFTFIQGFGRNSVSFDFSPITGCSTTLRNIQCKSCEARICGRDGSVEFLIDCSNVRVGAVTAPCVNEDHGMGFSLAASARKSALMGLIYPYLECSRKRVKAYSAAQRDAITANSLLSSTSSVTPMSMEEEEEWWNSTDMDELLFYDADDGMSYADTSSRPLSVDELANLTWPFSGLNGFVSPDSSEMISQTTEDTVGGDSGSTPSLQISSANAMLAKGVGGIGGIGIAFSVSVIPTVLGMMLVFGGALVF